MAEINTVIAEASQDLQTIEDFVNLPAGSDVRPRLLPSVNVGTLAGTRDAIFKAGGLPATPFATKALMTASALVDGDYAQVTDDTVNNGLYVKTAGVWVKSAYDPLSQSKIYADAQDALLLDKAFVNRGTVTAESSLSSYKKMGVYLLNAGTSVTDAPAINSARNYSLTVETVSASGSITKQTLQNTGLASDRFERFINAITGAVFTNWVSGASAFDNSYNIRGNVATNTALVDYKGFGSYHVPANTVITDAPSDMVTTRNHVLMNQYDTVTGNISIQTLQETSNINNKWQRVANLANGTATGSWIKDTVRQELLDDKYRYVGTLTSANDLNTIVRDGLYVVTSKPANSPDGAVVPALFRVDAHQAFGAQKWTAINSDDKSFTRVVQSTAGSFIAQPWVEVGAASSGVTGESPFAGKKMVCFGDSITEFKDYPALVGDRLGLAECLNVGFGGTTMGKHWDAGYTEASMFRLADAIGDNDFTAVTAGALDVYTRTGDDNRAIAARLAAVDWSTVDYISILFGTNDFGNSEQVGLATDMTPDGSSFAGSLNYSIKRIQESHPHIKILILTPFYRARSTPSGGDAGSDDSANVIGKLLVDYVDVAIEVARLNKIPVLDMLRESGINKYTASLYLNPPPDGVHLTTIGAELVAAKIASKLVSTY